MNNKFAYNQRLTTMSEDEMVDFWMLRMNLLPRHSGCTIERHDGCDVDRYLRILIRQWYADALANAYPDYLPQADIAGELEFEVSPQLVVTALLPDSVVRPLAWRLDSWNLPVSDFLDPGDYIVRLQTNDLTRSRRRRPVAVRLPGRIMLYSAASTGDAIAEARCVVRPPQGTYIFDDALISSMPMRM
ncbi:MAG: hypothetical protein ACI4A8_00050 [Muribaculaceae bacterium]